jgi:hypothetical protein
MAKSYSSTLFINVFFYAKVYTAAFFPGKIEKDSDTLDVSGEKNEKDFSVFLTQKIRTDLIVEI